MYRVSQKSVTFIMLLEPRCTNSITSSRLNRTWTSLCLENIFLSFLTKTKQDQGAPKSCLWEHLAPQHSVLVKIFGVQEHSESHFFLGHPVLKWQCFPAEALYLPPCPKALSLKHPPPDLPHPNYDKVIILYPYKKNQLIPFSKCEHCFEHMEPNDWPTVQVKWDLTSHGLLMMTTTLWWWGW